MRSRMAGIRAAKAEILIFLDSHIEAGIGWIEPLLFRIQEDPKVIKRTLDKRQIKNVYLLYCIVHTLNTNDLGIFCAIKPPNMFGPFP